MIDLAFIFFGFNLVFSGALLLLCSTAWGKRWMQRALKYSHDQHDQKITYDK